MMRRILLMLVALAAITALPTLAAAQQPGKIRIGWLTIAPIPMLDPFRQGLQDLGYSEGKNLEIIYRYAGGKSELLASLVDELAAQKPNVIVVAGSEPMRAAHRAIKTLPIVFVASDPVGQGIVESLARPGGNLTGLALPYHESSVKWIELVSEILPGASRIAVLTDRIGAQRQFAVLQAAAMPLQKELIEFTITDALDFAGAFLAARNSGAGAMVVTSSPLFAAHKRAIIDGAARHSLPTVYEHRDFVEAGGMLSYGPDLRDVFRRAASYVDRIVKGAKPAELPIEQVTKFEFVVNRKTARALGIEFSPALLARIDEVIE